MGNKRRRAVALSDAALTLARERWTLNPVQWEFVACDKRFSFYVGGVGAGKSYAGAVRAIVRAIDYPGSLGLIGAPTYAMLRDATCGSRRSLSCSSCLAA